MMKTRRVLCQFGVLCLFFSTMACYPGYDLRTTLTPPATVTPARPGPFAFETTSVPQKIVSFARAQPTQQPSSQGFEYLPRQAQIASHRVGDVVRLVVAGHPLQVSLSELKEPKSLPSALQPETRAFITTVVITNTNDVALDLVAGDFFQGMNSSGRRLSAGGRLWLESLETIHLPAKSGRILDLLWKTEVYDKDTRRWITVNMPIQEGGYIQPASEGAIFSFRLAEVGQPRAQPTPCVMSAKFVRETIDDDTPFAPGERFQKTWVIANNGTCPWIENSVWTHFSGESMGVKRPIPLDVVAEPGELLTITVPMTAPLVPGTYRGDWRLRSPSGELYCRSFYLQIVVREKPASASATPTR